MNAYELSRKYAAAVFSQALEKWLVNLKVVQNELANDPALLKSLEDMARPFADRQKALDQVIPREADQAICNFLYTLLRDGNIGSLGEVLGQLERMAGGGPQVQVARVTTAVELTPADRDEFQEKLRAKYGPDLEFVFQVDPAILGGAVVQIGDKVIDGSVAARLEAMSNVLGIKR